MLARSARTHQSERRTLLPERDPSHRQPSRLIAVLGYVTFGAAASRSGADGAKQCRPSPE
ncbi:hypothetical protein SAMN04487820_11453 [Actinopolyspora mzabensis]|uniref:Uncharacterized protein n=1 Tax=Actinopolyspora mzabensis TaxID=995066 RepID=A0A1G9F964_ACTMZ|nr:hypothetical protein SAMN04487820_11453 [Actinopolyspora mzabensis]